MNIVAGLVLVMWLAAPVMCTLSTNPRFHTVLMLCRLHERNVLGLYADPVIRCVG